MSTPRRDQYDRVGCRDFAAAFQRHLDDDREAFAHITRSIGDVGAKVESAANALQDRIGRLESDRERRDAVREYRDSQRASQRAARTVREGLGMSRRAWWLSVIVALATVAGVVVSAVTAVAH